MEILFDEPITFVGADGQSTHAPMVAAAVGGEATRLILDTGSTDHILSIELANRVGLSAEPGEEGTDSTGSSVPSWTLGDVPVQVGEARHTLANVIAIAAPGPFESRGIGGFISPQHLVPDAWMHLDLAEDRFMALSGSEADVAAWLTAQAPDFQLLRLARADGDSTILVRGGIEPFDDVVAMLDTGGKASDVVASAVPGLSRGELVSSGHGVGGSESFGSVVTDQTLRVGDARLSLRSPAGARRHGRPRHPGGHGRAARHDPDGQRRSVASRVLAGARLAAVIPVPAPNVHHPARHVFDVRLHAGPSRHGPQEHSLRGSQGRR